MAIASRHVVLIGLAPVAKLGCVADRSKFHCGRMKMRSLSRIALAATVMSPLLLAGACAQQGELDKMKSDIAGLRTDVDMLHSQMQNIEATRKAAEEAAAAAKEAAAAARQAAAEAKAASEKADRIFKQSMRK